MVNEGSLLQIIVDAVNGKGETPEDILWIGSTVPAECSRREYVMWGEFKTLANAFFPRHGKKYREHVDVVIVARSWWMRQRLVHRIFEQVYEWDIQRCDIPDRTLGLYTKQLRVSERRLDPDHTREKSLAADIAGRNFGTIRWVLAKSSINGIYTMYTSWSEFREYARRFYPSDYKNKGAHVTLTPLVMFVGDGFSAEYVTRAWSRREHSERVLDANLDGLAYRHPANLPVYAQRFRYKTEVVLHMR